MSTTDSPIDAQDELQQELSEAARTTANKHGRTVAICALRNALREMEGDLLSRDDLTPDEVGAIRNTIAYAAGRAKANGHDAQYPNINRASKAMNIHDGPYGIRAPETEDAE